MRWTYLVGLGMGLACLAGAQPAQAQAPAPVPAKPPAMTHDKAGREQCLLCHGGTMEGMKAAPANHKGFDVKNCTLCHKPAK